MTITVQVAPLWRIKYQEWLDDCLEVKNINPDQELREMTELLLKEKKAN